MQREEEGDAGLGERHRLGAGVESPWSTAGPAGLGSSCSVPLGKPTFLGRMVLISIGLVIGRRDRQQAGS